MRRPAVVGRCALIGYNAKQRYWSVGGESKGCSQSDYPHLHDTEQYQCEGYICDEVSGQWRSAEGAELGDTCELSGVTVALKRNMDTYIPAIMQISRKCRGLP